ncbi:hypothetical protein DSO57_1033596 [Entomophthora muscae]|uniref:Uncharacterized protein n=1 Tax=Entomophthora muscae TaxID=34485 RepID=A0ACC2TAT0_9FUNG|nr:hypothetical protein DSO57_1033596 [Entomophthora muscae]
MASNRRNGLMGVIQQHYGSTNRLRSEGQLARERWLIPNLVRFNRWILFPVAVVFQFCCGSLYAWSVYNGPIDLLIYGEDRQIAPITFYIAVGFFGISAAVMGPWLERNGPKAAGLLGSSLFLAGNLVTGLGLHLKQMWLVFLGYGVIGGFGLGLCYISPVSALQKWFPDKRGLGSGFAVCGFGAGSIVLALVPLPLSKQVGLALTFVILGLVFFVLMAGASLVLRTPPPGNKVAVHEIEMTLLQSLQSREFGIMYFMFFANAVFGLVVISRLSNMVRLIFGRSAAEASMVVSINGGFNLFGRLFFSVVSDFIGRKWCYLVMLTVQLIILGCFSAITESSSYRTFVGIIWVLTACYGGGFGVIPAFLTDMFGPSNIGACHGVILTAWSVAGVGGGLVFTAVFNAMLAQGYVATDPHPYNVNVWWIFAIVLLGWVSFQFLNTDLRARLLPKAPGELLRLRFRTKLVRIMNTSPHFVTIGQAQEDTEWQDYLAIQALSKSNSNM